MINKKNEKSNTKTKKTIKLITLKITLLDQQKQQEVKYEDGGPDQGSTGKPSAIDSGILDVRIQGLPHSEVEQVEEGRVRQVVDKIEAYPHKEDLQADLRQDNVYNSFSENSKKMIHELGNIEYFELCETDFSVQCSYCLSWKAQEILHCTCGLCLSHTDEMRQRDRKRFDTFQFQTV